MQTFPHYPEEWEILEPSFQVITNDTETVMVVIATKEDEPDEPSFWYDGEEALLLRSSQQPIRLVNIPDAAKAALDAASTALIVETEDGAFSLGEGKQIESDIDFSYELPLHVVAPRPKEKTPLSPILSALEHVVRVATWIVLLCISGLGFQVIYGGDRSFPVTSPRPDAQRLIQERNIRYLPRRKFYTRIFWTYVVKPDQGKFFYPAQAKGKIRVYKPRFAKAMGLRPVYSFWYEYGAMILWPALFVAAVLLSFTSLNAYDILKHAFLDSLEDGVEEA